MGKILSFIGKIKKNCTKSMKLILTMLPSIKQPSFVDIDATGGVACISELLYYQATYTVGDRSHVIRDHSLFMTGGGLAKKGGGS